MLVEGGVLVVLLGELLFDIDCVFDLVIILVLKSFRDFKQSKEGLITDRLFLILQVVDDVFGYTHVQTSFDLIGVTGLEDRPDHGEGTLLSSSINRVLLKSVQTLSDGDELVVVGGGAVHGDQEGQGEVVHLLGEDLTGLEAVADALDVVVEDGVAALSHSRLGDRLSVDLNGFLVQVSTPVVALIQEILVLLVQVPEFIGSVGLEVFVQVEVASEETAGLQEFLKGAFSVFLLMGLAKDGI